MSAGKKSRQAESDDNALRNGGKMKSKDYDRELVGHVLDIG
jgi:hypothetical protein